MNVLLFYIITNIKRQCAYITNLIGELILSVSYILIQFIFIDQITSHSDGLGHYSKEEVNLIFTVFVLLGLMLSIFTHSIEVFFEKVSDGSIEAYLTKPIPTWLVILFGWCKPLNVLNFLLVLGFSLNFLSFPELLNQGVNWFYFVLSLFCVFLINISFFIAFNSLTFLTSRKMPVDYFHEMVFELSFIPISIYPSSIIKWMLFIVPIAFSSSLPVSLFLNKDEWNIIYLIASTVLSFLLTFLMYKKAFNQFNGLGG